ncbi:hypothetical protein BN8_00594 [Fibrisoma limi BUZ 3]|uniref:Lipoprotein n=1 Tax=Fibrisoma limi BUZ 3 TaxID=1185876 RepID=I2GCM9_9BACT|nr:hypothetical protein [Fibrisoma limi]CCH51653.1 hypothetical protein BN8_00594 [Fibrisoma limi BUZ 3]
MKKYLIYSLSAVIALLVGCRDEALNPNKPWEPGVHALTVFADIPEGKLGTSDKANFAANGRNFPLTGQDNAKLDLKIRWVSLDNKLTVTKIVIKADMIESYTDPDGNPKTVSLGSGGKIVKTIESPAANRQWNTFSITPNEIYNLYKDATVKYDKVNAVKVFENPARPRPAGARLQGPQVVGGRTVANADAFVVTWELTTSDGLVFRVWNEESICLDPTPVSQANSNCRLNFTVR